MSMKEFIVKTKSRTEFIHITKKIQELVSSSKIKNGFCIVFVPHSSAGITINENFDLSLKKDFEDFFSALVPRNKKYIHDDGNADSHIKASLVGSSATVLIKDSKLVLGTWQGIVFCEFDGPRERKVFVKIVSD